MSRTNNEIVCPEAMEKIRNCISRGSGKMFSRTDGEIVCPDAMEKIRKSYPQGE